MNRNLFYTLALVSMTLIACSDNEDDKEKEISPSTFTIVLNTGNYNGNDASIMRYDLNNHITGTDLYYAANQEGIGDVAQDIIKYGSKYYVTVTNSSKLVVLDKDMKIIKSIAFVKDGTPTNPRFLASANGNVYVTAYDGCITKIDTTSLTIRGTVAVGDHPEGLSYANGKLYANISDYNMNGTGKYVAVVDEASFTKIKDITVVLNPYTESIVAEDGNVYIVSSGNYAGSGYNTIDIYSTVQCINTQTDEVSEVCRGTYISTYKNKLYVLYSEFYLPALAEAFVYDINTKTKTKLTDISLFQSINGIDVDPTTGDVYIYDSPYGSYGKICGPIQADGTPAHTVSAGYYTCKMLFE